MILQTKIGHIDTYPMHGKTIDWLDLEWHESTKRIQRKHTRSGKEIALKFLNENPQLTQGDIVFEDLQSVIVVEILTCDVLVIKASSMYEMASICYEIGNKHLPLFYEKDELLVPYDEPTFKLLNASGFTAMKAGRKLLNPLKTTVAPHGDGNSKSLFSKIMQMTSS